MDWEEKAGSRPLSSTDEDKVGGIYGWMTVHLSS